MSQVLLFPIITLKEKYEQTLNTTDNLESKLAGQQTHTRAAQAGPESLDFFPNELGTRSMAQHNHILFLKLN